MSADLGSNIQSIVALFAALIAAITSIFVAIMTRKAQQNNTRWQGEIQRDLNAFNDILERGREFTGFRRERITQHLDQVIDSYIDLYAVAQLIPLRKWLYSNSDLETEARFRLSLSCLRAHFGSLESLGVIPDQTRSNFEEIDWEILESWNLVMSEAALRTEEYRKEHPDAGDFSKARYHERWMNFMTLIEKLGKIIKSLSKDVSFPQ